MEFTQTKHSPSKEWLDESGNYRITWRDQVDGITVTPGFYSCVKCDNGRGKAFWGFCGARRPYKTYGKAVDAAMKHRRTWERAQKIAQGPYKGRADRLRELRDKATAGTGFNFHRLLDFTPLWVECDETSLRALRPKQRAA